MLLLLGSGGVHHNRTVVRVEGKLLLIGEQDRRLVVCLGFLLDDLHSFNLLSLSDDELLDPLVLYLSFPRGIGREEYLLVHVSEGLVDAPLFESLLEGFFFPDLLDQTVEPIFDLVLGAPYDVFGN